MWYILTFIAGSAVGVCLMCLLQINRRHPQMEYDFEAAKQKGGSDEKS